MSKKLFVGNLSFQTSESDITSAFEGCGSVESVSIITDRETGRSKGFGFVVMTEDEAADKAIAALNGSQLGGRALTVNEAKPMVKRDFGGGGYRGGGGGGRGGGGAAFGGGGFGQAQGRSSGRGGVNDPDVIQGRRPATAQAPPPGEDGIPAEFREQLAANQPPPEMRPRVVLRFADERDLLVSGMLAGGSELAGKPAVLDVPVGKGHVVMFANNPMWRHETHGSFSLLFNAALNFDHLHVGRPAPRRGAALPAFK